MILISASLPKSASSILATYQADLLEASSLRSGQKIFQKINGGRFIEKMTPWNCLKCLFVNTFFGSILVKTHSPPRRSIRILIDLGFAKATYIYRDPRDVVLSGIDHGNRESSRYFETYLDVPTAIKKVHNLLPTLERWLEFDRVLCLRYENFIDGPIQALRQVSEYFDLNVSEDIITRIVAYREKRKHLNPRFNKGIKRRFEHEMSKEEQRLCEEVFGETLKRIGYL